MQRQEKDKKIGVFLFNCNPDNGEVLLRPLPLLPYLPFKDEKILYPSIVHGQMLLLQFAFPVINRGFRLDTLIPHDGIYADPRTGYAMRRWCFKPCIAETKRYFPHDNYCLLVKVVCLNSALRFPIYIVLSDPKRDSLIAETDNLIVTYDSADEYKKLLEKYSTMEALDNIDEKIERCSWDYYFNHASTTGTHIINDLSVDINESSYISNGGEIQIPTSMVVSPSSSSFNVSVPSGILATPPSAPLAPRFSITDKKTPITTPLSVSKYTQSAVTSPIVSSVSTKVTPISSSGTDLKSTPTITPYANVTSAMKMTAKLIPPTTTITPLPKIVITKPSPKVTHSAQSAEHRSDDSWKYWLRSDMLLLLRAIKEEHPFLKCSEKIPLDTPETIHSIQAFIHTKGGVMKSQHAIHSCIVKLNRSFASFQMAFDHMVAEGPNKKYDITK